MIGAPVFVSCAITGGMSVPSQSAAIPVTPDEIVDSAVGARAAGLGRGEAAVDLVAAEEFGHMAALQGDRIGRVPLTEASKVRPVPEELAAVAELFFEDPPPPDDAGSA